MDTTRLKEKFLAHYGSGGEMYSAPGRVNIIGEHTDYNGGFVLPGAIDKAMYCIIKPNGGKRARVTALDLDESCEFGFDEADKPSQEWARYIFGVCRETMKKNRLVQGFDAVFSGDVPIGAGVSSSAALECCFGFALNDQFGLGLTLMDIALIGQASEHNYVGMKCGIMDQFASCYGKENYLMRLDCLTMEVVYVPFNIKGYRLVLIDTCMPRSLATGGEYNKRRASCERVIAEINKKYPRVHFLRDVDMNMLKTIKSAVNPVDYMRAEFVIEEIQRLLDACIAMEEDNDFETVGQMMYETHEGLSRMYAVSCLQLDYLIAMARGCGVTGARVMGGGFGGCTINLVTEELHDTFLDKTLSAYKNEYGIDAKVYDVVIKGGVRKIS